MRTFHAGAREQFQKLVDFALLNCQKYQLRPMALYVDHNLMIDVFGSQLDTSFGGLPVQALPLTYGWDHLLVVGCEGSKSVAIWADGDVERLA